MTGAEIVGSLVGTIAILQSWNASRVQQNTAKKEAAEALSDAVSKTQQIIASGVRTDAANYELTNVWHKASLAFRDARETKLSDLCRLKGNYWMDPTNWTPEQVRDAGIQLSAMRRELQRILRGQ